MLVQRLGSLTQLDENFINTFIKHIKKNPKSCDEVWFATEYGFPKIEKHKETAKIIEKMAEKFRESGIKVSLQLSNSIGHGQYMLSKDCSGLVYEGSPIEKMVGYDGEVAEYCFCWNGKHFKEYLFKEIEAYMPLNPDTLWIDDDFRAANHAPVMHGCFCGDCIKRFNSENGLNLTREEIKKEMLHGDKNIRRKYAEFIRKGLYDLMYDISKLVSEKSPKTDVGLQSGLNGTIIEYGMGNLMEAIEKGTGRPGKYRAGGGVYNDHNPIDFIKKAIELNVQHASLPENVTYKSPEIENLPFVVYGKTADGTAFETSHYFANGSTNMTYSMIMYDRESFDWYNKEFELFSRNYKYWEKMSECNKASYQKGIRYFLSRNGLMKPIGEDEGFEKLMELNALGAVNLTRTGVPIAYDSYFEDIFLLYGEMVESLSEDEVEYLLSKNVITDGKTVEVLLARGYDLGIEATEQTINETLSATEVYTDHSVNNVLKRENTVSFFTPGKNCAYFLKCKNGEILGKYDLTRLYKERNVEFYDGYDVASVAVETKSGGKWAVLGYSPWKGVISSSCQNRILNIADYISGNALPAKLLTPFPAVLNPRADKNGKTVMVSLTNCTIGDGENLELLIRNPKSESFTYMTQNREEVTLDFKKLNDNEYLVEIPFLKAWTVGTVFVD